MIAIKEVRLKKPYAYWQKSETEASQTLFVLSMAC